ncbi:MAG: hypothetical protein HC876_10335 [Chloroflexaceae bacterium]|nr:hypothetical protein [Chloroflexaceae bacterium]
MLALLQMVNELLNAAVVIVVFSLFAYLALHNWRNGTARALCVLLLCVVFVYGGDILVARAARPDTIQFLLRAQWVGIALVPAAYLHLATSLSFNRQSPPRQARWRWYVRSSYAGSIAFFALALATNLVVQGGIPESVVNQAQAGPLFSVYVIWLLFSMLLLLRAILEARQQALTPGLRRRLTYLVTSFMAPGLGVFPYLAVTSYLSSVAPQWLVLLASSTVSVGIMGMLVVMTYSVAFQGILLPDRLIKYDFARWGLYGPLVGVTIILVLQVVPILEAWLGLPADTLITFAVMMMTVLMPIIISRVRSYLDALVFQQDQAEINYLRSLPRSTFTRADLRQLLDNTLIAVCGSLGVETGFVVVPGSSGYSLQASCGSQQAIRRFLDTHPLDMLLPKLEHTPVHNASMLSVIDTGWVGDGFRLLPLWSPDQRFMGALGVEATPDIISENGKAVREVLALIDALTHQIELALTTVDLQQRLFDTLRGLGPEMQSLQQLTSQLEHVPAALAPGEIEVANNADFTQLVKDALTHYWGGPKLSDSPLLGLRSVRRALRDNGSSPTRALQAVLRQAINNLRPDEQLDPTAQEWVLYNILDLRFLQGKRTREVANRLAMSESDFYRKQRIAVEEVARQLALMETTDVADA